MKKFAGLTLCISLMAGLLLTSTGCTSTSGDTPGRQNTENISMQTIPEGQNTTEPDNLLFIQTMPAFQNVTGPDPELAVR